MARRSGFTLVETLLVVVVIGLTTLIALPRFSDALASGNLASARTKVITLHAVARATATGTNRTAVLHLAGNQVFVTASPRLVSLAGSTRDTVTPVESLYGQYGVSGSPTVDSVVIEPTGLGRNGSNLVLVKGAHVDTVLINQYGQVKK